LFFEYTKASFASFCGHHDLSCWRIIFADLGMQQSQKLELSRFGEVIEYSPSTVANTWGQVFPSARAKLQMLTDLAQEDSILLFMDSDTLVCDNLDKMVLEFAESRIPIAIAFEDIAEFYRMPASHGWRQRLIPKKFQKQHVWRNAPMGNTGVIFAQGAGLRDFGKRAINLYEIYGNRLQFGDQTAIVSLLYDLAITYMRLPVRYNCFAWEKHITHLGKGVSYVTTEPHFQGERVAIRHFCGRNGKSSLNAALPFLDADSRLLHYARK
jgi:hypothetical protein